MHRTLTCPKPDRGPLGLLGLIVLMGLLVWNPLPALDARVAPAALASSATVRIDPPEQVVDPGATFTIDIVVEDVSNLGAFEFKMSYDPALLQVTDAEQGDFLSSTGRSLFPIGPDIDNQAGVVQVAAASLGAPAGPDGAGILATITLTGAGEGVTELQLYDVLLADPAAAAIAATVRSGRVKVGQGPMPTAVPTEVPAESPTPTATEGPAATGTPAETDVPPPDPQPTATPAPGETPEGETPTPGAITPTEEAEAATATAAAGVPAEETAAAMTPSPAPDVATDTPDPAVDETAEPDEPQEATAEAPEPLPTDADEALETDGGDGAGINWLLIAAAVLTLLGVAAVAVGVLMFKAEDESGQDAS